MASRLPGAVDKLRRHLRDAIPDNGDLQLADGYLLDVINSLHDPVDSDGGEAEASRTGYDHRARVGLDHMAFDARGKRATPAVLKNVLKHGCPPPANEVR